MLKDCGGEGEFQREPSSQPTPSFSVKNPPIPQQIGQ